MSNINEYRIGNREMDKPTATVKSLSILLLRVRENICAKIRPLLDQYDITEQQWRVIRELHRYGTMSAKRLAEESGISIQCLSRVLSRLTELGLVVRETGKRDRRVQRIYLSEKGERLHELINHCAEKQYRDFVETFDNDTLERLIGLLREVEKKSK